MIERYEIKEMSECWSLQNKFEQFLKVEIALMQALESENMIPRGASLSVAKVIIDLNRIDEIEKNVHHDVIAFTTSIAEQLNSEVSKYFHFGVTSSDIIDTALSLNLKNALELIEVSYEEYLKSIERLMERSESILTLGRSHGMYAEPMILAQKWLGYYAEAKRGLNDLQEFKRLHLVGKFSGAVGNYTILNHEVEQKALQLLGLKREDCGTQIIPRDRLARFVNCCALVGTHLERFATEIRLLHHSDVNEVAEGFSKGQKGSSTMPHKKNPIASENITGLARMLRSYQGIAMENIVLWHERDISHSSAERMYLPDMCGLLVYALKRMTKTLDHLEIYKDKIEVKVKEISQIQSSFYLHQLILKSYKTREELYSFIQELALKSNQQATKTLNWVQEIEYVFPELKGEIPQFDYDSMKKHYQGTYLKTRAKCLF